MKEFYTSGEFAKKANVSTRTIRYYDNENILKPSSMSPSGYRRYTDSDFARLQKILCLRYLGFSLEEIRTITVNDEDKDYISNSMKLQIDLVGKRIEDLKLMEQTLTETLQLVQEEKVPDWNRILSLIHISNMEKTLVEQYKNSANVKIRIDLHERFATNPQGWFHWLYSCLPLRADQSQQVLEVGCGNGMLWKENEERLPKQGKVHLTDLSKGMLKDAKDNLKESSDIFDFLECDVQNLPFLADSMDLVVGNHVLFYVKDLDRGLKEISRVLKNDGSFYCSTYGKEHMKEISQMVKEFDSKINLSEVNLYEIFGLENGKEILEKYFDQVEMIQYPDSLVIDEVKPLMDYILSCHGNQQEHLVGRYEEFREFLEKKMKKKGTIHITKSAGVFCCRKSK